jgi:chromosome segregation ATPase
VTFPVVEKTIASTSVAIGNVSTQDLELYLSRKMLSPEMEQALRKVLDVRAKIADVSRQIDDRKREASAIATDEDRIRKNLGSLGTTGSEQELRSRYVTQLGKNEDRLGVLKQEQAKLENDRNVLQAQLDQMIRALALEYRP